MAALTFRPAVRRAVPLVMSLSSVSGGGKTYTALLLAAGMAGPKGRVGLIDTENGRGALYADSPGIAKAYAKLISPELPHGYVTCDLPAPHSPARYIEAIDAAEQAGVTVLVIDSGSHEWEGTGGCADIAERDNGRWNKAKIQNRKYVYRLLYSNIPYIIVCLRAREKSKIISKVDSPDGKEHTISLGVLPIAEKNFVFEMMLSLALDEKTHHASPIKVPEPLLPLFPGSRVLGPEDGERIRIWNETGAPIEVFSQIIKRARAAAEDGMEAYKAFWSGLTPAQRKGIGDTAHAENKAIAVQSDRLAAESQSDREDAPFSPEENRRLDATLAAEESAL